MVLLTSSIKYTPTFKREAFVSYAVVKCLSLLHSFATTQLLCIADLYKFLIGT